MSETSRQNLLWAGAIHSAAQRLIAVPMLQVQLSSSSTCVRVLARPTGKVADFHLARTPSCQRYCRFARMDKAARPEGYTLMIDSLAEN